MVKIIEDILEVYDFACEMSTSETRRYPSCDSKLRIWQLIQKGLENKHDFVLAVFEKDVCQGVFVFCHEPDEQYLEMTLGYALHKTVWQVLMDYLHEHYQKYELYVICANENETLKEVLHEEKGFFQNEQIEMKLNKPHFKETQVMVHPIEKKDEAAYIAMHVLDGWWTASRVLERKDLFQVYIAEDGNQVVGYVDVHIKEKSHHVFDLYVSEDRRGKGIGRALMQMVMKNSAEGLTLEVDRVNETAYHLYKNLGFEEGLRKTAVLVKC